MLGDIKKCKKEQKCLWLLEHTCILISEKKNKKKFSCLYINFLNLFDKDIFYIAMNVRFFKHWN